MKSPAGFFAGINKLIPKLPWKFQEPQRINAILKKICWEVSHLPTLKVTKYSNQVREVLVKAKRLV